MNTYFESHFSEDALESYALRKAHSLDCGPIEEHLLLCEACRTHLMKIEEFILVVRAALAELQTHPLTRIGPQPALAL
jgi:predicted anti-sigma-YlaC factor YlaD